MAQCSAGTKSNTAAQQILASQRRSSTEDDDVSNARGLLRQQLHSAVLVVAACFASLDFDDVFTLFLKLCVQA